MEEEDEEAEIRQRRLQRQAIVQVHGGIRIGVKEITFMFFVSSVIKEKGISLLQQHSLLLFFFPIKLL